MKQATVTILLAASLAMPAAQADPFRSLERTVRHQVQRTHKDLTKQVERTNKDIDKGFRNIGEEAKRIEGDALAELIRLARSQAAGKNPQPIPGWVRQQLLSSGKFTVDVLDSARYVTSWSGVSLPEAVMRTNSDVGAIVMDNIILFRDASETNNLWLWAHEMQHVAQYKSWGINNFATKYVRDYGWIESDANRAADYAVATLDRQQQAGGFAPAPYQGFQEPTYFRIGNVFMVRDWYGRLYHVHPQTGQAVGGPVGALNVAYGQYVATVGYASYPAMPVR